jgi:hypothetical protein
MLEYVFFDARPRQRFVDFLRFHQVPCDQLEDGDTFGVAIPEDTDAELLEAIEDRYDELMTLDQALVEADEADAGAHAAGVVLNLASGQSVYARVRPALLAKVMEVLTAEELGELVNAVVDAVEHPDARSLCASTSAVDSDPAA